MKDQNRFKRISIICFIVMLVMFIVHVQILVTFNRKVLNVHGNDSSSPAYMDINTRGQSTSRWEKRDYPLTEDRTVTLFGETIDQTLYNNSGDSIRDWGLRINIAGDCFINQAWTGEVEIHQFVGSDQEQVQRINLQDYALDDVKLAYRYDGDLLIPLQKGDYLIYFPNEYYTEMPVRSGDKVTIGMIFYYLEELDLSDYDLTIHFNRGFHQGWSFIPFIAAAVLWVLALVMHGTSIMIYRNTQKQRELRKSGLSYMSELYEAIYIITLSTGEITPVSSGEYIEKLRQKHRNAKDLLDAAVRGDADENELDATLAFVDTDTVAERLKDRDSITHEFLSSIHGWCRFRFFAMDRTEGKPLDNVIFAVQDINDERSEAQNLMERLERAEAATTASNSFLSGASRDLQAPVKEVLALDEQILGEADPQKIREYAERIHGTADRMLYLINGLAHRAEAVREKGKAAVKRYSLKQIAAEAVEAVQPMAEKKQIRLETEIQENIPDALIGDAEKLKEATASLLANAVSHGSDGTVRLSVFGKILGETVHLLVSIRALPEKEAFSAGPVDGKAVRADSDLDLEVAGAVLASLGSELKSVRSTDAWKDLYFEIEQQAADFIPAGKTTAEEFHR